MSAPIHDPTRDIEDILRKYESPFIDQPIVPGEMKAIEDTLRKVDVSEEFKEVQTRDVDQTRRIGASRLNNLGRMI